MERKNRMLIIALSLVLMSGLLLGAKKYVHPRAWPAVAIYEARVRQAGFTPDDLCVHSIGQSHIDAAWRWRVEQTHTKVYRTWSQAIDHMDRHPDFTFSGSAPQYYEWLLEEHPDLFEKIVEREKEGRWEIVGGQWIEPDGNMPDGEAFVRQRLLGQRFYLEHFGHISEVGWMLDSFGYHRNMPQIMAKSGAKYMWTSKLTWNDTTVFPFHNFWWRSPDGSEVLTHITFISPYPLFFPFGEIRKHKDNRYLLKDGVEFTADYTTPIEAYRQAQSDDWQNDIGIFYGLGDGGLGPREVEVKIQEGFAARGYSYFSTGLELFKHIEEDSARMPVWDEEMYLEMHRGVQTTQAWIKRANRKAEQDIKSAEVINYIAGIYGAAYPYERIKKVWKLVLLQQFHDILPGSSIPEVYEDARKDYDWIDSELEDIRQTGLVELAKNIRINPPKTGMKGLVVFNPLPWSRSGLVSFEVPDGNSCRVMDAKERTLNSERIKEGNSNRILFRAENIPSTGYKTYFLETRETAFDSDLSISDDGSFIILENDYLKVRVDKEQGWITSLVDRKSGREMIDGSAGKLMSFRDRPSQYSAWNINENYLERPVDLGPAARVSISREGPLFVEALVEREIRKDGGKNIFNQRIRLADDDPVVYMDIDADHHLHDTLTKIGFNTTLDSNTITSDGPYLALERPAHPKTEAEKARWEISCHKWIDFSDGEMGLALLNNGKYGFSLNEDGTGYSLSIIKGARYPRANPGAKDVRHHFQTFPIPTGFTDQEKHHIELGLLVHEGDWREARLWEAGNNFNTPFETIIIEPQKGALPSEASFISLESDSSYIGSIKKAEDNSDIVVRLIEAKGSSGASKIKFGQGLRVRAAEETDLLELNPKALDHGSSSVSLRINPYEIKTIKIKLAQ